MTSLSVSFWAPPTVSNQRAHNCFSLDPVVLPRTLQNQREKTRDKNNSQMRYFHRKYNIGKQYFLWAALIPKNSAMLFRLCLVKFALFKRILSRIRFNTLLTIIIITVTPDVHIRCDNWLSLYIYPAIDIRCNAITPLSQRIAIIRANQLNLHFVCLSYYLQIKFHR